MSLDGMFHTLNVTASGLSAERLRMEVIANNIANANATRTQEGGPFRRQDVIFEAVLQDVQNGGQQPLHDRLNGVRVVGLIEDSSEMPRIHNPGHPDADAEGFVTMPNVQLPIEMVNLITATRAYEAGLKVARTFREMTEQSLTLIRG